MWYFKALQKDEKYIEVYQYLVEVFEKLECNET